jgi:hypothetical protein
LKDTVNVPVFTGYSTKPSKSYKSYIETSVRGFIKICLSKTESKLYGIPIGVFESYNSIIEFVYGCKEASVVKLTPSSMSYLKHRNTISRAVPRTVENEIFIDYVKKHFNTFNSDLFFREFSDENIKNRKRIKKSSS